MNNLQDGGTDGHQEEIKEEHWTLIPSRWE